MSFAAMATRHGSCHLGHRRRARSGADVPRELAPTFIEASRVRAPPTHPEPDAPAHRRERRRQPRRRTRPRCSSSKRLPPGRETAVSVYEDDVVIVAAAPGLTQARAEQLVRRPVRANWQSHLLTFRARRTRRHRACPDAHRGTETLRTLAANETASRFIHLSCRFRGPSACADSRTSRVRLRRIVQGDHGASTVNAISCAISVTTAVPERTSPRGTASEFIVTMH